MAVPAEIQRLPDRKPTVLRHPERRISLRFRLPIAKTEWQVRETETGISMKPGISSTAPSARLHSGSE